MRLKYVLESGTRDFQPRISRITRTEQVMTAIISVSHPCNPRNPRPVFFPAAILALAIISAVLEAMPVQAQSACHATEANVRVMLPGRPYAAVASADGCSIFVSLQNSPNPGSIAL